MAGAAERLPGSAAAESVSRTTNDPTPDTGGKGAAAVYEAVEAAKAYLPTGVRVLKQHAGNPVRGSRDAVAAVRLLWEMSQEKVVAPAAPETRASGKLLLVDVHRAEERLRAERMREQQGLIR